MTRSAFISLLAFVLALTTCTFGAPSSSSAATMRHAMPRRTQSALHAPADEGLRPIGLLAAVLATPLLLPDPAQHVDMSSITARPSTPLVLRGAHFALRVANASFHTCPGAAPPAGAIHDPFAGACQVLARVEGFVEQTRIAISIPVVETHCDPLAPLDAAEGRQVIVKLRLRNLAARWPLKIPNGTLLLGLQNYGACLWRMSASSVSAPADDAGTPPPRPSPLLEYFLLAARAAGRPLPPVPSAALDPVDPSAVLWAGNAIVAVNDLPPPVAVPIDSLLADATQLLEYAATVAVLITRRTPAAAQMGRWRGMHQVMLCRTGIDRRFEFVEAPAQRDIGPDDVSPAVRHLLGTVMFNSAIVVGLFLLHLFVGFLILLVRRRGLRVPDGVDSATAVSLTWRAAFAEIRFPGCCVAIAMVILQPTMAASTLLMQNLSSSFMVWQFFALFCIAAWIMIPITIYFAALGSFAAIRAQPMLPDDPTNDGLERCTFRRLYCGAGEWRDKLPDALILQLLRKWRRNVHHSNIIAECRRVGGGLSAGVRRREKQLPKGSVVGSSAPLLNLDHDEASLIAELTARLFFVRRYGSLFTEYRQGTHWFILVEFALSIAVGAAEGVDVVDAPEDCGAVVTFTAAAYVMYLLAMLLVRPCAAPLRAVTMYLIAFLQCGGACAAATFVVTGRDLALQLGAHLPLIAAVIAFITAIVDTCVIVVLGVNAYRRERALENSPFRRRRGRSSPFTSSTADGNGAGDGASGFEREESEFSTVFSEKEIERRVNALRRLERKAAADQELVADVDDLLHGASPLAEVPLLPPEIGSSTLLGGASAESPRAARERSTGGLFLVHPGCDDFRPAALRNSYTASAEQETPPVLLFDDPHDNYDYL